MKKTILSALVLGCVMIFSNAQAQRSEFGIRAGVNFQNLTGKDQNGTAYNNNMAPRFHAGVNVSIPVAKEFYVRPEVLYTGKGTKSPAGNQYHLNYLEVPLNLLYKPQLGSGKLMLGFGPFVAFGLGGKVSFTNGVEHDVEFRDNVASPAANTAYYKQTDAGFNVLAGYEFGRLSLQLNAQQGLVNVYPEFNGVRTGASLKNSGVGLSLGVRL